MTIGQYIKEYRIKNNISQREFALKCKLSNTYISMLEKDYTNDNKKVVPTLDTIKSVAIATNISLIELISILDEDEPYTNISNSELTEKEKRLINIYKNMSPEDKKIINALLNKLK